MIKHPFIMASVVISIGSLLLSGCGAVAARAPSTKTTVASQTVNPARHKPRTPTSYTIDLSKPAWTHGWQEQAAASLPAPHAASWVVPVSEASADGTTWWIYPHIWHHRWWFASTNAAGQGRWVSREWNQSAAPSWPPMVQTAWDAVHQWQQSGQAPHITSTVTFVIPTTSSAWNTLWRQIHNQSPTSLVVYADLEPNGWSERWLWNTPVAHGYPTLTLDQYGEGPQAGNSSWVEAPVPSKNVIVNSWSVFRNALVQAWELPANIS